VDANVTQNKCEGGCDDEMWYDVELPVDHGHDDGHKEQKAEYVAYPAQIEPDDFEVFPRKRRYHGRTLNHRLDEHEHYADYKSDHHNHCGQTDFA
jgi:hypothetical protein